MDNQDNQYQNNTNNTQYQANQYQPNQNAQYQPNQNTQYQQNPYQANQYQPNQFATYDVPPSIKKWNWGAFMFNITWGIGNKTYLPLLCLVPFVNLVMPFICGAMGNEWAWKNGNYSDPEEFLKVQSTWNRAGIFSFILTIVVLVLYFVFFMSIIRSIGNMSHYSRY